MNDAAPSVPPPPSWLRAAGQRLGAHWLEKTVGITAGTTAFFLAYFWVLHHPSGAPRVMSLTALDRWIPFQPFTLPLYLSLWIYVSLAPGLMPTRRELVAYALTALALSVAGLAIFFVWPTAVPPAGVTWADDSLFAFLKATDASGNACPSLHVAFAVFTALVLGSQLRQLATGRVVRTLNWLWCAGIVYSTVATRQHVVLDVIAGAALGFLVGGLYLVKNARRQVPDAK